MALDPSRLLAPVSDDDPTGPDLAYDPQRYEIEQAFETEVSIDASGVEAQASDVDWRAIIAKIGEQSARTKDIWLAIYLCRAGARAGDWKPSKRSAKYLAGLLEAYWPSLHPRVGGLRLPGAQGTVRFPDREPAVHPPPAQDHVDPPSSPRHYSIDDFERFRLGGETEPGYGMFRAALEDVSHEGSTRSSSG
jgi:hypothetical protein